MKLRLLIIYSFAYMLFVAGRCTPCDPVIDTYKDMPLDQSLLTLFPYEDSDTLVFLYNGTDTVPFYGSLVTEQPYQIEGPRSQADCSSSTTITKTS
jgi:hypothetical protein